MNKTENKLFTTPIFVKDYFKWMTETITPKLHYWPSKEQYELWYFNYVFTIRFSKN